MLNGFGYTAGLHIVTPQAVIEIDSGQYWVVEAGREGIVRGADNPTHEEDAIFVEAVRGADPGRIRSPYADAVKTLAVTLAANESAAKGKLVTVAVT
ncbi:MAG TPA: hypothetical protein VLH79_13550 [Chthonomonadales bacterium]|nr:hypothetical protein [Chthonomonadales bacterium]